MKEAKFSQKSVDDLALFFDTNKINNPKFNKEENTIKLNSDILNYNTITTLIGTLALLFLFLNLADGKYKVLVLGLLIAIPVITWQDFEGINKVIINLSERSVLVISKNIIKRLFFSPTTFLLSNIKRIDVNYKDFYTRYRRYRIIIQTNEGSKIILTEFKEEKCAIHFSSLLKSLAAI